MSASTNATLLLSLIALAVLLTNASKNSPGDVGNNDDDSNAQRSARDWLNNVLALAGSEDGGHHVETKRIAKACALDCLNCGMRLIVRAYSQGDCLMACQKDQYHRDPSCQEHVIL